MAKTTTIRRWMEVDGCTVGWWQRESSNGLYGGGRSFAVFVPSGNGWEYLTSVSNEDQAKAELLHYYIGGSRRVTWRETDEKKLWADYFPGQKLKEEG